MNLLKRLFGRRPTVNGALSSLSKAVRQLEVAEKVHLNLKDRHLTRAERHLQASVVATTKSRSAGAEAERAARVRRNITDLLK